MEPASTEARHWLLPLAAYRAGLMLFVLFAAILLPSVFSQRDWEANLHWPPEEPIGLHSHWKTWDAQHYLYLAQEGYRDAGVSAAFWPLWPWTIRAVAPVVGGNHHLAALILANLFSLVAVLLLLRYANAGKKASGSGHTAALLFLAYPSAFFLGFPYSESLFIALAIACLVGLAERRYALTTASALLLPLTRAVGAFIILPIAYHLIERWRGGERLGRWALATLAAPLVGVGLYLLGMAIATGSPWTGLEAQKHFIAESTIWKMFDPVAFARTFVGVSQIHGFLGSAFDRALFVLFVVALVPLWKRDRTAFFYALPIGLVPAMTLGFMAFSRYLLAVFPLFVVVGAALETPRGKRWRWLVLAASFALQVLLLLRHVNNLWVA